METLILKHDGCTVEISGPCPARDRILRAIVSHNDLLAACKRVLRAIEWAKTSDRMTPEEQSEMLRAVVAKAKE